MRIARFSILSMRTLVLLALCLGTARGEDAPPPQYVLTIAQGVSRAEATTLISGSASRTQSTRGGRTGTQRATLRVTSGFPARVETGEMLYAVERVYVATYGGLWRSGRGDLGTGLGVGISRTEKPVTRGFSVTATQRGELVDVEVEPFATRPGETDPANRQVQTMQTRLRVRPGEWVAVGGGTDLDLESGSKLYGTSGKLGEGLVLIKVDPVTP